MLQVVAARVEDWTSVLRVQAKRAKAAQAANGSSDAPPQGTEANAAASVDAQQPAADKPPGADAGTASAAAGNAAEGTKNTGEDLEVLDIPACAMLALRCQSRHALPSALDTVSIFALLVLLLHIAK